MSSVNSTLRIYVSTLAATLVLLAGFLAIANVSVLEDLGDDLLDLALTTAPGGGTTRPAPMGALVPLNATALQQTCLTACGQGGVCSQNNVTGITACTSCPLGYTISPQTNWCVNTAECAQWPWCSEDDAADLSAVHFTFIGLALNANRSRIDIYPYPYDRPAIDVYVPQLGATNAQVTDLLNSYLAAKTTLVAHGNAASPGQYWDDENGYWGSNLDVYKASLLPVYASYVTTMKRRMCSGRQWVGNGGACVPPVAV